MGYYIIKDIRAKNGELKDVHKNMIGRRAYFLFPDTIENGYSVLLKVDVLDKMGVEGMHTIRTTNVLSHSGEPGDDSVTIETLNTVYVMEADTSGE